MARNIATVSSSFTPKQLVWRSPVTRREFEIINWELNIRGGQTITFVLWLYNPWKRSTKLLFCSTRYNGSLPNGDRGRRKSRFALFKRPKANGVKPSTVHIACTPQAAKVRERSKEDSWKLNYSFVWSIFSSASHFGFKFLLLFGLRKRLWKHVIWKAAKWNCLFLPPTLGDRPGAGRN